MTCAEDTLRTAEEVLIVHKFHQVGGGSMSLLPAG